MNFTVKNNEISFDLLTGLPGPKGTDGAQGLDGKSAYEIAVEYGYLGTPQDWLMSLQTLVDTTPILSAISSSRDLATTEITALQTAVLAAIALLASKTDLSTAQTSIISAVNSKAVDLTGIALTTDITSAVSAILSAVSTTATSSQIATLSSYLASTIASEHATTDAAIQTAKTAVLNAISALPYPAVKDDLAPLATASALASALASILTAVAPLAKTTDIATVATKSDVSNAQTELDTSLSAIATAQTNNQTAIAYSFSLTAQKSDIASLQSAIQGYVSSANTDIDSKIAGVSAQISALPVPASAKNVSDAQAEIDSILTTIAANQSTNASATTTAIFTSKSEIITEIDTQVANLSTQITTNRKGQVYRYISKSLTPPAGATNLLTLGWNQVSFNIPTFTALPFRMNPYDAAFISFSAAFSNTNGYYAAGSTQTYKLGNYYYTVITAGAQKPSYDTVCFDSNFQPILARNISGSGYYPLASFVYNGELYVVSGSASLNSHFGVYIKKYNPTTDRITTMAIDEMNSGTLNRVMIWKNNKLHMIGSLENNQSNYYATVYNSDTYHISNFISNGYKTYDPATNTYTTQSNIGYYVGIISFRANRAIQTDLNNGNTVIPVVYGTSAKTATDYALLVMRADGSLNLFPGSTIPVPSGYSFSSTATYTALSYSFYTTHTREGDYLYIRANSTSLSTGAYIPMWLKYYLSEDGNTLTCLGAVDLGEQQSNFTTSQIAILPANLQGGLRSINGFYLYYSSLVSIAQRILSGTPTGLANDVVSYDRFIYYT